MNTEDSIELNNNFFDLYEFIGSLTNKWYLYIFYVIFLFSQVNNNNFKYIITINNNNGPRQFLLNNLANKINSNKILLIDKELESFLDNKLDKENLNSIEIKSLQRDIEFEKDQLKNKNKKEKEYLDIMSIRKNIITNSDVLRIIEKNKRVLEKYEYDTNIIDNNTVEINLSFNKSNKENINKIFLLLKNDLIEYSNLKIKSNIFKSHNKQWVTLIKSNIKANIIYIFKTYLLTLFLILLLNIIINLVDQKIYTLNRASYLLDRNFDFIIYSNSRNLFQKLESINDNVTSKKNVCFLIAGQNKKIINKVKSHDQSNKINIISFESIDKKRLLKNATTIVFITGFGLNSSKELLEIKSFFKSLRKKIKIRCIYLYDKIGFL